MKTLLNLLFSFFILNSLNAQVENNNTKDNKKKLFHVEAACGQCQFKLAGKSCDLAIRIKGKSYFVDGTNIDEHGDAHGTDGFCNAISKAEVQGEVVDGRFKATYFKLIKGKNEK